jgi:hypothetical protein
VNNKLSVRLKCGHKVTVRSVESSQHVEDALVRPKEQLRQEICEIMLELHGEGKYPTIKRVGILLNQRSKWAEVSVASVRKEFR